MSKNNTDAIEAFITHKGNIANLLKELTKLNDDHMGASPEDINWADVGSLQFIQSRLIEIADMAGLNTAEILDSE